MQDSAVNIADVSPYFSHRGICPVCEQETIFCADGPYFRSTLKCRNCQCGPRQCAFMYALNKLFPDWRRMAIHECSPGWDLVSRRLHDECELYTASQYDTSAPWGTEVDAPQMPCKKYLSQNLEKQTFEDGQFDLVITLDVFEHVFHPDLAIKEIARTLRPNGATIMTVPIVRMKNASMRRARLVHGRVENILPAQLHGSPISKDGSLVTIDWGYDIVTYLQQHSGMGFLMLNVDNIDIGSRADFNEVLVGFKTGVPLL
jgi:SAM-dependent methyltransferase